MADIMPELLYTKEHEWIRIDENIGTIGITDYAQKSLGDIVYVELHNVGEEIDAGDEFGTIESVKSVSPLFMPVSGKIIEVNVDLEESPELINDACYGDGWLIRVELVDTKEEDSLLSADEYRELSVSDEDE